MLPAWWRVCPPFSIHHWKHCYSTALEPRCNVNRAAHVTFSPHKRRHSQCTISGLRLAPRSGAPHVRRAPHTASLNLEATRLILPDVFKDGPRAATGMTLS